MPWSRIAKIAWRNVFRNKRRSLLTLMILILGSTGLLMIGGFFENVLVGFKEQYIHSQTGHIQVNAKGYHDEGTAAPFDYLLGDVKQLQEDIETKPEIRFTVPRLKFGGMVTNEKTAVAVIALGTDPVREEKMGNFRTANSDRSSTNIIAGKNLDPNDPKGVLLGKGLRDALDLKVGDKFYFLTNQATGSIDGEELHVRGVFETIVKDFDDRSMKMNLETAQSILDTPDQVHNLLVILDETNQTDLIRQELSSQFQERSAGLEFITWLEQGLYYQQSRDTLEKIYATIQFIIMVIFLFSIANVINMNLFERIQEFGTMMAIGNGRGSIFLIIFLEAAFLGILGALLGLGFGILMGGIISAIGIPMPPPPQGTVPYHALITLTPKLLAEAFLITLFATMLSSLLPGYRASHFPITEALGYV